MEEITILHTNDLHSHLENWPKIRRFLNQEKLKETANHKVLTFDIGDFSDRVHPFTEATDGQGNVLLMNQVSYDGVTIGNNEGIGNEKADLNHLYDQAQFPVILSNLLDRQTGEYPEWAVPYKIYSSTKGTKIGVIGLTAPFPFSYRPSGWTIAHLDDILPGLLAEVKKQADVIVLLFHLGIIDDEHLAEHYPDIGIIIGSHTHHLLETGEKIGNTLLTAAGRFGEYVGKIKLTVDQGKIISQEACTYSVIDLPEAPEDQEEIAYYLNEGNRLLEKDDIGCLPVTWSNQMSTGENSFAAEGLKALEHYVFGDVYLLNTGLFLGSLGEGLVTKKELHEKLPHPMHLIRVKLLGKYLFPVLNEMFGQRDYLRDFPIVGMGFRGRVFGELVASHVELTEDSCLVNGQLIKDDETYQLVMVDHYIFVKFFPSIRKFGQIEALCPSLLRKVVGKYISDHYPCN
ncbi:bifunctional metallophosphatase/5'-nucleotidase [Vagococcus elongatus]|uniref:Calcineurin-like phosphoesterase domain-containing protein n=1 Tax=Vagococcus elongatus TaxID=180344 RepID=A0A430AMS0_9ENTE|nr:metallophosphatase [Vagococcus elongatus]RSU09204.1 hypothetical protein CBF29_12100 [Vagococcus elongatus]